MGISLHLYWSFSLIKLNLLWTLFVPIFQNPCLTDPCPHSFICQVGFRDQGYRCVSGMKSSFFLHFRPLLNFRFHDVLLGVSLNFFIRLHISLSVLFKIKDILYI